MAIENWITEPDSGHTRDILVTNHRIIEITTVEPTAKYIYFTCRFYGGAYRGKAL